MLEHPFVAATDVGSIAAAAAGVLTAIAALYTFGRSVRSVKVGGFSVELAEVEDELNRLTKGIDREAEDTRPATTPRFREVDKRSFALFEQYHTQGLAQS